MDAGPVTVEFGGDSSLRLIADEWNRGQSEAPTIVMLHGGGQNRFSWKNTGQLLAERGFHVIALDARGHGDSDRSQNAEYTVDAFARDAAAVLKQIGRPVVLIGADCAVLGAAAVTESGTPAYCARLDSVGDQTIWSQQPERLRTATSAPPAPPAVP